MSTNLQYSVSVGAACWHYLWPSSVLFGWPAHTHQAANSAADSADAIVSVFPGDTLFALGCGRMFEGNAQQMWTSLSKLKPLPPATKVFCAHEYTQSNAKFALSIDPDNQALQKRAALINDLRKQVGTCLPWSHLRHKSCLRHASNTEKRFSESPCPACLAVLAVPSTCCWPAPIWYDSTHLV